MKKIRDFVLKGQRIYVGLEDAKKSWKISVRSNKIVVQRLSIEADYERLRSILISGEPYQVGLIECGQA
jgi:hypothetical protein